MGIPRNRVPLESEQNDHKRSHWRTVFSDKHITWFSLKKSKLTLQVVHIAIVIGFTPHFDGLSPQLLGFL